MKFIRFIIVFVSVASTAAAVPPEILSWQEYPTIEVKETVPKTEIAQLTTLWQLDCSENAEPLVGQIVSAAPGLGGRTLLLDSQLVRVLVVGAEGVVEKTVGRQGEGPGDFPDAYRTLQLRDGRIGVTGGASAGVIQYGGMGKIVLLDEAGAPAGMWFGAGEPGSLPISSVRELRCANDHILSASQYLEMSDIGMSRVLELSVFAPVDGSRSVVARLVAVDDMKSGYVREASYYEPFASGRCDISSNGRVAFAPERDLWMVVIRDPDGAGFVLERNWTTTRRSKPEMESAQLVLGASDQRGVLRDRPAVGRVRWRPDGKLWVEVLGIDPAPGVFVSFDEFSAAGQLLRRVQVKAPGDRDNDLLVVMENGRFALLRGFKKTGEGAEERAVIAEVLLLEIAG